MKSFSKRAAKTSRFISRVPHFTPGNGKRTAGGKSFAPLIPLSVPRIGGNAWKYVKDCLDTQWVSSVGAYVTRFEEATARYAGTTHAVAGVNGTACLHVALRILGIGPGDGVIVPSLTFIATANAASYCGATCLFIDCDARRFNIDLDSLEEFLEKRCERRGKRLVTRQGAADKKYDLSRGAGRMPPPGVPVKAVLAAHILGYPIDMDRLLTIAGRHGLLVIEDAAESIGSFWKGRHTGTFGKAGILSFNGNKIITTGGGGVVLTDDAALARRARHVTQQAKADPIEYVHDEIGFNYRMTNVCAALGLSQIELLPKYLQKRRTISGWYRRRLPGVPVEPIDPGAEWNRWLFSAQVSSAAEKTRLLREFERARVQARPLWPPLPLQKPYRKSPCDGIPNARRAYETVLNIPSSTSLTEEDVDRVARILRKAELTRLLL